jgi:transposase InsO family protein
LVEAGLVPSLGSVADSYDNALAETINGLYKAEVIHRRGPWRSLEAVEHATLESVNWSNNRSFAVVIGACSLSEVVDDLDPQGGPRTRHLNPSVSRLALPPLSSFPRMRAVAKRLRALYSWVHGQSGGTSE